MYGAILGFHRRVWWPKWTPASSSWRMLALGIGMVGPFPVGPPQGKSALRESRRHRHRSGRRWTAAAAALREVSRDYLRRVGPEGKPGALRSSTANSR